MPMIFFLTKRPLELGQRAAVGRSAGRKAGRWKKAKDMKRPCPSSVVVSLKKVVMRRNLFEWRNERERGSGLRKTEGFKNRQNSDNSSFWERKKKQTFTIRESLRKLNNKRTDTALQMDCLHYKLHKFHRERERMRVGTAWQTSSRMMGVVPKKAHWVQQTIKIF